MTPTQIYLAALLLVCAVIAMALMWVIDMKHTYESSAKEDAERIADERFREMCENTEYRVHYDRYIVCGKGYQTEEDKITMTKSIMPSAGALYVHLSGRVYKCLRITTDGCPVMMDINTGTLLTVSGCRANSDGKVEWNCVAEVAVC